MSDELLLSDSDDQLYELLELALLSEIDPLDLDEPESIWL